MRKTSTFLCILFIGCFFSHPVFLLAQPAIDWSSYFGGPDGDLGRAVAYDSSGNIFIAGITNSSSGIASSGAFQTGYAGGGVNAGDAFLAKFSPGGSLLWATYFGGNNNEQGLCLATDPAGNVYLGGYTRSTSGISTPNAFQATHGGSNDAFLAKFNPSGTLLWSTYYGGSANDQANALAADKNGHIYMAGTTRSTTGISSSGAHQPNIASSSADDAFIVKFDSSGNRLWATYYGGNGEDIFYSLACDGSGNVYAAGWVTANSTMNIASPGAFQGSYGGGMYDGLLVKFTGSGQRVWGTYYGSSLIDQIQCIAVNDTAGIFISGLTTSTAGMSTSGAFQTVFGGGQRDGFIARFDTAGQRIWSSYYGGTGKDQGDAVVIDPGGYVYLCGVTASDSDISTPGIIKDTVDQQDIYLSKFDMNGQRIWGTYIGGSDADEPFRAGWHQGNIYITGQTTSISDFSTPNSFQPVYGGGGHRDAFLIKINDCPAPLAPASISGDTLVCPGGSYTYSVPSPAHVLSYSWMLPGGWTGNSHSDTIHVMIGQGLHGQTDTIRIRANYVCGSSSEQLLAVQVSPRATVTLSGPQAFCSGDSLLLQANTDMVSSWRWLKDGVPTGGVTDSVYTVFQSGAYAVVTDNGSCTDTSAADTVTVHPLPQPVIVRSGQDLSTGSYAAYQWYYNQNIITGATGHAYTMLTSTGVYSVEVVDSNGCAGRADYDPTFLADIPGYDGIVIYPNPVRDRLVVESAGVVRVSLFSMDGRKVLDQISGGIADVSGLPDGVYQVLVYGRDGLVIGVRKLVKGSN